MKSKYYEICYNPKTKTYRIWDYQNDCWDWDVGDYCHTIFETRWKFLAKRRCTKRLSFDESYYKSDTWTDYEGNKPKN